MPIKLNSAGGGSVTINAASTGSATVLTVPATNANLVTTGDSGTIASSMIASGAITSGLLASGAITRGILPTGTVLQVAQAYKTDTYSTTSTSLADVSGLSVTLTPTASSSKFLIMVNMTYLSTYFTAHIALIRNSTEIGLADLASNRPRNFLAYTNATNANADGAWVRESMDFLDSPATASAITYKLQASARRDGLGGTFYINRCSPDRDTTGYDPRGTSSIIVMEIAA